MFKKILVPLDGSKLSEFALNPALALAQANKAELILMSAVVGQEVVEAVERYDSPLPMTAPLPETQPMLSRMGNYLESIAETHANVGVSIRTLVMEGDAASCVVETAVSEQVTLIIMGTHGRSGVSRLLLGSVTQKVWQQAPCPVMAIRDEEPLQNILIPVDQIMMTQHALDSGFVLSGALAAQVHLLIVSQDAAIIWGDSIPLPPGEKSLGEKLVEDIFNQEGAYLLDLQERYQTKPPITAVRSGEQTEAILAYAKECNIDLIILNDNGRSGVRRWFQTSSTDRVMRESLSSLLILKPTPYTASG